MEQSKEILSKTMVKSPASTSKLKIANRPKPINELQVSTKSILNATSPINKPNISVTSPKSAFATLNKNSKSEKNLTFRAIKKAQNKSPYEMAIRELKLPTSPSIIVSALPNMQQWMRKEIETYSQVFFLSKNEKIADPNSTENDGEFKAIIGDDIDYKYEIVDILGKGTFGQVLKVYDHENKKTVAMKIIKNQQRYFNQSLVEIEILKFAKRHQADSKAHIVTFEKEFIFRSHMVRDK